MKFKIDSDSYELSKLIGIKILYKNDLYEFAKIVLNIMDASDKITNGTRTISRPTINGLSKKYSWICGEKVTSDQIIKIVMQHGLKGNDSIDFDENDKRRYIPPKIGAKKT